MTKSCMFVNNVKFNAKEDLYESVDLNVVGKGVSVFDETAVFKPDDIRNYMFVVRRINHKAKINNNI